MQILLGERDEAGITYGNAAKCFKRCSPEDAISALKQAVEILTDSGRFHNAANHMKQVAEIYESDLVDLENSMRAYETAADWYAGEDSTSLANACWIKVATFAGQLEQYEKAFQVFEEVASASLENQLTKYSVKDYFLKAGICHLCTSDIVGTQRALQRYTTQDMTFGSTREYKFLEGLAEAVEAGDIEGFTEHVVEFDQLTKLDAWKTTLLLRIKQSISEEPSLT